MSCLLPQFKCLPDSFLLSLKTHQHSAPQLLKGRDPFQFRTQCVLSTTSASTSKVAATVLDIEKLQLPSIEVLSNSVAADRSWKPPSESATTTIVDIQKLKLQSLEAHSDSVAPESPWRYSGGVALSTEANTKAALATENLLTGEEAVIAAAAAEAVALAKAAVKVAKDAVILVGHNSKYSHNAVEGTPSIAWITLLERVHLAQPGESARNSRIWELKESEMRWSESNSSGNSLTDSEDLEPTHEELELLQAQLLDGISVRSKCQNEWKARRARAAERASANVVSRASVQDVDYSDPLRYLRGTTSTSRLLTASEEHKLSDGIQDLLKLERLQEELAERCGGQPTFGQWAAAAGVDQKTLRKRIHYGILCKDKMIKSNIRLVISIAKNYQGAGMNLQDLVQEGCRGLVRGAEKFDASKGFKFSTYAHWWIKQAVRKSLSDQSRTIRLPFHMVEATYRVKEARKQLYSENGRHPDEGEIAEATGLSMKRLSAEVIADPEAETSEEMLIKQFMKQDLQKVLDTLNPRERQVIRWRFGLEDGRMKTLQEIGELMGSSAFRKLKNKKRTRRLQQYIVTA
ncbi:unnamed protein product [Withania somnifera]